MQHLNNTNHNPHPFIINLEQITKHNRRLRSRIWTGKHIQLELICIPVEGDSGFEFHSNLDQFIYIEQGCGVIMTGKCKERMEAQFDITEGYGIMIPAGTWHDLFNSGCIPLKLYTVYAPPEHVDWSIVKPL